MEITIKNAPTSFFRVQMEDENYLAKFIYLDTDYEERFRTGTLQPGLITVQTEAKNTGWPSIVMMPPTDLTKQHMGIDMTGIGFVEETALDEFSDRMRIARKALEDIKACFKKHFPGIIQYNEAPAD